MDFLAGDQKCIGFSHDPACNQNAIRGLILRILRASLSWLLSLWPFRYFFKQDDPLAGINLDEIKPLEGNGPPVDRKRLEAVLKGALDPHGLGGAVNVNDILYTAKIFREMTGNGQKLSEAIINQMFKPMTGPIELAHFTGMGKFESIVKSGELRLYCLLRRIDEDEFTTFASEHKFYGYFDSSDGDPAPYYNKLAADLFYTSFTSIHPPNEAYMWDEFAEHGTGVKLIFRLEVVDHLSDLRSMTYQDGAGTLLSELNKQLEAEFGRPIVLYGTSRIGAFYLPLDYDVEDETRLFIKRHQNGVDIAQNDGTYEYIPLPLNADNEYCQIDLIRVEPGAACDVAEANRILQASVRFPGLSVSVSPNTP